MSYFGKSGPSQDGGFLMALKEALTDSTMLE